MSFKKIADLVVLRTGKAQCVFLVVVICALLFLFLQSDVLFARNDRLDEIAFGSEFNDKSEDLDKKLYRWKENNVVIEYEKGNNDVFKNAIVAAHKQISEALVGTPLHVSLSMVEQFVSIQDSGTIRVQHQKPPILSDINYGLFIINTDSSGVIKSSNVYVDPQTPSNALNHIVLEEVTQSFGLMEDTYNDKTSIFYQGWTTTPVLNENDKKLLNQLYSDPRLITGMTKSEYFKAIQNSL